MRQMQREQREWAWRGQEGGEQPKQNAVVVARGHNHLNERVDKVMCVSLWRTCRSGCRAAAMILARPTWLVRQRGGARARVPTPCHLQQHKRKALITRTQRDNFEDEKMKPGDKSLQHRMNFPIPASTRPLLCCACVNGCGQDVGGRRGLGRPSGFIRPLRLSHNVI
jgi:hypothetical protein